MKTHFASEFLPGFRSTCRTLMHCGCPPVITTAGFQLEQMQSSWAYADTIPQLVSDQLCLQSMTLLSVATDTSTALRLPNTIEQNNNHAERTRRNCKLSQLLPVLSVLCRPNSLLSRRQDAVWINRILQLSVNAMTADCRYIPSISPQTSDRHGR